MKVEEIMTRNVVSCPAEADLAMAAKLMWEGRFGTLPVVDAHGRVAGILTDRDIALAVATRCRQASHIAVHEAMSPRVRTCAGGDDVGAALREMEDARVRRLPVIGADARLAGILSIDDIALRALDRPGGVPPATFIQALQRICTLPDSEPESDFSDTFVSG